MERKLNDMDEADGKLWALGRELLRILADAGHEAYMVGGSVRDRLIGRPIHDIDIATSALPEQVQALFPRTLPTGLAHGTVTVMADGIPFEVTTYRTEAGYSDARRPDEVAFVRDIKEDLSRRDFTFNAMAVGLDGELLDPFGGRSDLAAGIVRTVGRAADRFGEDALRMLRAIRFGAELGFELAADTWDGIEAQRERLAHVAMERVGAEWDKMIAGSGPDRACSWLLRSGLLAYVREPLPVVDAASVDAARAGAPVGLGVVRLADLSDADERWAAFWIGVGAVEAEALEACKTLRLSGKRGARIAGTVGFERRLSGEGAGADKLALFGGFNRAAWIEAVIDFGIPVAQDWLAIRDAARAHGGVQRALGDSELEERSWLAVMPISRVGELAIRGDELSKRLGRPPGPWVASLLRQLLSEVAHGRVVNDREALAEEAERLSETDVSKTDQA